jgi:hypothetical protein
MKQNDAASNFCRKACQALITAMVTKWTAYLAVVVANIPVHLGMETSLAMPPIEKKTRLHEHNGARPNQLAAVHFLALTHLRHYRKLRILYPWCCIRNMKRGYYCSICKMIGYCVALLMIALLIFYDLFHSPLSSSCRKSKKRVEAARSRFGKRVLSAHPTLHTYSC